MPGSDAWVRGCENFLSKIQGPALGRPGEAN